MCEQMKRFLKGFSPIEEYAKIGSGFLGGKERIVKFFNSNNSIADRAEFLKKEYGIGGFGIPGKKMWVVHSGQTDGRGSTIEYYNENMHNIKIFVTYKQIAETINDLIERGEYI